MSTCQERTVEGMTLKCEEEGYYFTLYGHIARKLVGSKFLLHQPHESINCIEFATPGDCLTYDR